MEDDEQTIPLNVISSNTSTDNQIERYFNLNHHIEKINYLGSQQIVALQLTNPHRYKEVVELILTNNAFESLKNISIEKLTIKAINQLLNNSLLLYSEEEIPDGDYIEWSLTGEKLIKKRLEFREQIDLYKTYDNRHHLINKLILEIIHYYIKEYLVKQERLSKTYAEKLEHCFQKAIEEQNYLIYFIEAYTSTSNFHRILNRHLALYILDYFDITSYASSPTKYRLINCLVHIVTLLINNPDLNKYQYSGITFRGLLMKIDDLQRYNVDTYILNRSFVSTSQDRLVAEMYAGSGQRNSSDHYSQRVPVLFRYTIKQMKTGIDITHISSIRDEAEVLILPFSVFRITDRVENCPSMDSPVLYEIDLVECEDNGEIDDGKIDTRKRKGMLLPHLQRRKSDLYYCLGFCLIFSLILAWILTRQIRINSNSVSQGEKQKKNNYTIEQVMSLSQVSLTGQAKNHQATKLINELPSTSRRTTQQASEQTIPSSPPSVTVVHNERISLTQSSTVESTQEPLSSHHPQLKPDTSWKQSGVTIIKDSRINRIGNAGLNPYDFEIDDDRTIVIVDYQNHRVLEWITGATSAQVVAGGNLCGNRSDQLNYPTDVIIDKEADRLIICDRENRRVVQWQRHDGESGETIISHVKCFGIAMDIHRFLYVSDLEKYEVRRWQIGESQGELVAGGNGKGDGLHQFHTPHYVFIDGDLSLFMSDSQNHRVIKWANDTKDGIAVAGSQNSGHALTQLSWPEGIFVDQWGSVYVADCSNHRIVRWLKGAADGSVVVGRNGYGSKANQLNCPMSLKFDLDGNLYVADYNNNRIQKFYVNKV